MSQSETKQQGRDNTDENPKGKGQQQWARRRDGGGTRSHLALTDAVRTLGDFGADELWRAGWTHWSTGLYENRGADGA